MKNDSTGLNERSKHLLKVLIEGYIVNGQPVGSTILAKRSGLDLSPATIRNVMASLEDAGYIHSPHTSAGRIPTSQGYRLFVDTLVSVKPIKEQEHFILQEQMQEQSQLGSSSDLIHTASNMLSGLTQMAGIIVTPQMETRSIRHIEFLHLSATQILVVLVMSNNDVENRIINVDREFSTSDLQHTNNYLNEVLVGKDLKQARKALLQEMKEVREDMNAMMLSAINLGEKAVSGLADDQHEECVIAGRTNLMDYDDLSDVEKLRQLFNAFNHKQEMLDLLDKSMQADGIQIFIGSESGQDVFGDCSVVTAPYQIDDDHVGVLGVIGPKRMQYERVIPVVDITARLLSAALNTK